MSANPTLRRHWQGASDTLFAADLKQARDSVAAFADATTASGSLLQSWIEERVVVEFEDYPPNGVVDFRHGSQFLRWRTDREPASCTYDQLEVATPVPFARVVSGI